MNDLRREPNDLLAYWTRYDWRESFFAPGIAILQALTLSGKTASGAGESRDSAFRKCLGETAEFHALAALERQGQAIETGTAGLAAHVDAECAKMGAVLEASERAAVMAWWSGDLIAAALPQAWLEGAKLTEQLGQLRHGAALKRRTGWWRIETPTGQPHVMICRSMSPEGQDMVLGFGADGCPGAAARKALNEMLLMEMNLMELMAGRAAGLSEALQRLRERIVTYGRRCPDLLPQRETSADLDPGNPRISAEEAMRWFGGKADLADITPPDGPINVWICRPNPSQYPYRNEYGSPFL